MKICTEAWPVYVQIGAVGARSSSYAPPDAQHLQLSSNSTGRRRTSAGKQFPGALFDARALNLYTEEGILPDGWDVDTLHNNGADSAVSPCTPSTRGGGAATKQPKLFSCPVCPFSANRAAKVDIHMRSHTGERPYACPHCTYRAFRKDHLQVHMLRHQHLQETQQQATQQLQKYQDAQQQKQQ